MQNYEWGNSGGDPREEEGSFSLSLFPTQTHFLTDLNWGGGDVGGGGWFPPFSPHPLQSSSQRVLQTKQKLFPKMYCPQFEKMPDRVSPPLPTLHELKRGVLGGAELFKWKEEYFLSLSLPPTLLR